MDITFFKKLEFPGSLALFRKRETSVIGVDFGSSSLKLVQLRKEKEQAVLETYGELAAGPYGGGEVGKSVRLVSEKVTQMLSDLLKEANVTARRAVVSVPLRSSFVTQISLPLMSEAQLKEAIGFEARRYIPVPVGEVVLDWWVLPQGLSGEGEKEEGLAKERKFMEVLLVAIHREVLEKYKSIFEKTGIEITSFEIEVFSQVRAALFREVSPVLLVDFGSSATRFSVVDYGIVRISHSLDKGSQDLTQALSRSLGIDFERAEKLKRDTGLSPRPEHQEIRGVLEPVLDHIFSEGQRVAEEYRRRSEHSLRRLWLCGGASNLKGLVDFTINKFGVEARLAHPFSRVDYPAFLEPVLKELGPVFTTSLGLALRELQLG